MMNRTNLYSIAKRSAFIMLCYFSSCNSSVENQQTIAPKHERLLSFRSSKVYNSDQYRKLSVEDCREITSETFDHRTDTILYKQDTLYISYLIYLNSCGAYDGNIRFENDTLILLENNLSKQVCTSGRVDRFMFTIANPENKAYIVKRKLNSGVWLVD
jgi:hypothetical protein